MIDRSAYTDPGYNLPKDLQAIYTPCIIWALEHPQSGCWMTVREVGTKNSQTQICFFLQWRVATEYSAEPIDVPGAIFMRREGEDGDALERRVIACARKLWAEGPVDGVISAKATWDANHPKRHTENGAKGGKTRVSNAVEKRDNARVEAGVAAEPGAPVALPVEPVALLENEFWEVKDTPERISYISLEHNRVVIEAELRNGFWYVERLFPMKNGECDSDRVFSLSQNGDGKFDYYEAIAVMNKIAATDPTKWKHGDYSLQPH